VALSGDGGLVFFYSGRSDLVPGDTNGVVDLFAKRMSDGTVTRVSTTATGANLAGAATGPALAVTPDGRYVLFPSASSTGVTLLYRKDLTTGALAVVSQVTAAGRTTQYAVHRDAGDVALSDDGRYAALVTTSRITTTTPTATASTGLAYRVEVATGAAVAMGSGQLTTWEHQVELDPTGRWGFFTTAAAELAGDTDGHTDAYRRDLSGGGLVLVTADAAGRCTSGPATAVGPAEYGRVTAVTGGAVLVTTSQALLPADTNKVRDLYAKDLATGAVGSPLG
jgi:hypothetical protein